MQSFIMIDENIYFDLLTSSLFFGEGFSAEESRKFYKKYRNIRQKKQNEKLCSKKNRTINVINLVPSFKCDGRCLYCYNGETINFSNDNLTLDKVREYIKTLEDDGYIFNVNNIRCYGGEPLLNLELSDILIYLHNYFNKPLVHISSGLLFSDNYFEMTALPMLLKLKEFKIDFAVATTVDFGSVPYTRLYFNNENMYEKLLNRLEILLHNNIKVVYATVVNKNTNIKLFQEQLEEVYQNIKEYDEHDLYTEDNGIRQFSFRVSIANHDEYHPSMSQVHELYESMLDIYEKYPIISNLYPYTDVVCGCDIVKSGEGQYTFVYPVSRCGVYTYMIEFFPDHLGVCHMNLLDEEIDFTKNSVIFDELTKNDMCETCDYELVCRKGCPYRKNYAPKSVEMYCQWIRYSFELAWKRLYNMCDRNPEILKEYVESHINKKLVL